MTRLAQYEKCYRIKQHDHVILADTGEVLEFCDPRIQQIKATLEELFDIEVLHHNLNIYARKNTTIEPLICPQSPSCVHNIPFFLWDSPMLYSIFAPLELIQNA